MRRRLSLSNKPAATHPTLWLVAAEILAKMSMRNYKSSFSKPIVASRRDHASHPCSFRLNHNSRGFGSSERYRAGRAVPRQSGFRSQCRRAGSSVKRVVDGIMQPYLAQGQRTEGTTGGSGLLIWERLSRFPCMGRRYFFPYGKATDAGAPITRETVMEIGSCTKTFTTTRWQLTATKSSVMLSLRNTCLRVTRSARDS